MLVAWITNHRKNGFFIFRPGEGYEYVMTLTVLGVVVGTLGPGQWSIDDKVHVLNHLWGWPGFAISLGAGALGAATPARDVLEAGEEGRGQLSPVDRAGLTAAGGPSRTACCDQLDGPGEGPDGLLVVHLPVGRQALVGAHAPEHVEQRRPPRRRPRPANRRSSRSRAPCSASRWRRLASVRVGSSGGLGSKGNDET